MLLVGCQDLCTGVARAQWHVETQSRGKGIKSAQNRPDMRMQQLSYRRYSLNKVFSPVGQQQGCILGAGPIQPGAGPSWAHH